MKLQENNAPNLVIVMPAYNEAACIEKVARAWLSVASAYDGILLIVNDGSRDNTAEVLNAMARKEHRLKVVHQENAGHGKAVRNGYEQALRLGPEFVFQTDSDDQFNHEDFGKLWDARYEAPFILGYRQVRHDPLVRIVISRLNAVLLLVFFGAEIRDANVPFRLMQSRFLAGLLTLVPRGVFIPNIFLSILAAKSKGTLLEMPVSHRERRTGVVTLNRRLFDVCNRCFSEIRAFRRAAPVWKKHLAELPIPKNTERAEKASA